MSDLIGKVAVVTGGSRGIGRAITLELARQGADVAVNYFRNSASAQETARQVEALGRRALLVKAHVGEPEQVKRLFQEVKEAYGGVDILVNNAASGVQRSALDLEAKHWDWTLDINARGPWLCAKEAAPLMRGRGGGRIVNISSLGSHRVMANYTAVGVSKAALEALTRYLAVELAPDGIVVNAVSGGLVETEALDHFPNKEEMLAAAVRDTPAGRMVKPEDIAKVVAFLCSDAAQMIVGQTILVDGGMGHLWRTALPEDA
jgi:enoyl-[acyl-carrier protein] reductase III